MISKRNYLYSKRIASLSVCFANQHNAQAAATSRFSVQFFLLLNVCLPLLLTINTEMGLALFLSFQKPTSKITSSSTTEKLRTQLRQLIVFTPDCSQRAPSPFE